MSGVAIRFGENLRRCRRRAGLCQHKLAAIGALTIPADELLDGIDWLPGDGEPSTGTFSIKGGR